MRINTILTLGLMLPVLAGCGAGEVLNSGCGGDMRTLCTMVLGSPEEDLGETDEVLGLEQQILDLKQDIATLFTILTGVQQNTSDSSEALEVLEEQMAEAQADLAELQLAERVTGFIDPCGDDPGRFDEVLLLMNSGAIVSYFKDGGNREFLGILPDGNYQTTDRQSCSFSIVDGVYSE